MKGFGPALIKGGTTEADKSGKLLGGRFGKAMAIGVAGAAAGVAAAGAILYTTGKTFDDVNNTIRVGTGATGDALKELNDVAKSVGQNVPAEWDAVANTVADLNTRMGLSGDVLDKVAQQYLEAGRILGEDVDVQKTSAAFNAFGIEGEGVSDAMDHLFRVSQATGVGMNDLAQQVSVNAPAVQQLGFSFEETTALVGNLDKAGLNSSKMMAGMGQSLVRLAKDGEEPRDAFERVSGEITGFIEEGDKAAAIDLAGQVFGTRNAPQFIKALEDGTLSMEDLGSVAGMTEDTILEAGQETMQFAEQWQLFKNNVMVWLEPLATRVFGAINDALAVGVQGVRDFMDAFQGGDAEGWFADLGSSARDVYERLLDFGGWISSNRGTIAGFASVIGGLVGSFLLYRGAVMGVTAVKSAYTAALGLAAGAQRGLNAAMRANPIGLIVTLIGGLVAGLTWFFTQTEAGEGIWTRVWGSIKSAASSVIGWFTGTALPWMQSAWESVCSAFKWVWESVLKPVWDALASTVNWVWNSIIQPIFGFIQAAFRVLGSVFSWVWNNVIKPMWDMFVAAINWVWTSIVQPIFNLIVAAFRGLGQGFMNVWNNIIKPVFDFIAAIITWVWVNIAQPYFQNMGTAFKSMGDWLSRVWSNVIQPMIQRFGDWIVNLYRDYIQPALGWISDRWDWLSGGISTAWDTIRGYLRAFGDFVQTNLVDRISDGVDRIKSVWDAVAGFFREPINWVINTVWNDGLRKAYNAVADLIPGVSTLDRVGGLGSVPAFAKGGVMDDGWKLVGEEGPELIRTGPGWVATATETQRLLSGGSYPPLTEQEFDLMMGRTAPTDAPIGGEGKVGRTIRGTATTTGFWGSLGNAVQERIDSFVDLVRGSLADGFRSIVKPITDKISGMASGQGRIGEMAGGFIDWGVDEIADWIAGKDAEQFAADGSYDGAFTANPGGFNRPAAGGISSWAGQRGYSGRFGNMHYGVDIANSIGTTIRAAFDGVVKRIYGSGLDKRMVLGHRGFDTSYLHNSAHLVGVGETVTGGQPIARIGSAGTGPHLHFELHPGGWYNPSVAGVNNLFRDKGGLIYPGMNQVLNNTGKAEYAFNQQQFDNLNRMAQRSSGGPIGGDTYHVHGDLDQAYRMGQEIRFTKRSAAKRQKAGV